LTDSGRFTHKVVKRPSISLVQDRKSSPARTDVLTTNVRIQLYDSLFAAVFLRLCMSANSGYGLVF